MRYKHVKSEMFKYMFKCQIEVAVKLGFQGFSDPWSMAEYILFNLCKFSDTILGGGGPSVRGGAS